MGEKLKTLINVRQHTVQQHGIIQKAIQMRQRGRNNSHLADCTVETSLHMVLALVTSVDEAILALVMQLHQHAHGAPLGPPQGAKLKMLVACQCQKSITAIHEVTCH